MNKKASIQLSVNFLVVMMISIIIIGLGFVLINRMIDRSGSEIGNMDDRLRSQIENLLVKENRLVAIPMVEKEINRGRGDFFGIGIMNLDTSEKEFNVVVKFDSAFDRKTGDEITPNQLTTSGVVPNDWIRIIGSNIEIGPRDKYVFSVGFAVPNNVMSGMYIFDVSIVEDNNNDCFNNPSICYDNSVHKLYVLVN